MKSLHLTLRQLQIFVAIAQNGTTTAASDAISLSQSAVSAALNELERILETQLFDRVGKRLVLNENGIALLKQSYPLLDMAEQLEASMLTTEKYLHAVKVGASLTIGNYVLPKLLQQFTEDATDQAQWNTEIIIDETEKICHQVSQFELDIGLVEGPCRDTSLQVFPWQSDEVVVVASPEHPVCAHLDDNPKKLLAMLRESTWLVREQGSCARAVGDNMVLPKLGKYKDVLELSSSEAVKQCALLGLGVACLSNWTVDADVEQGKLVRLDQVFGTQQRMFSWVCHQNKVFHPALQQVLDALGCIK